MTGLIVKYFILLTGIAVCLNAEPANDGKYRPSKTKFNDGKYKPDNEAPIAIRSIDSNAYAKQGFFQQFNQKSFENGKYVHKTYPYMHIHDNRELGRYFHVHIPYDGGYGPYSGDIDKYRYVTDGKGSYDGDNRGNYNLYTVSNNDDKDPFNIDFYEIPKPEVPVTYGFPDHTPQIRKRSILTSRTTTTTTERPRTRYNDEGKWRIIRQEEQKKKEKYDYLYLTENGIYAEEQAKLANGNMAADGTNAQGYYQYTGDDGKLYKVVYTVGEQGFVPMADHIPTPPPVPIEIQRALEYVAAKRKAAGKS